jgi:hypothetical protein
MSRYESWSDIAVFFRLTYVLAILEKWYFWWALFERSSIRSVTNTVGVKDEVGHWTFWKDQGYDSCFPVWMFGLILGTFVEADRQWLSQTFSPPGLKRVLLSSEILVILGLYLKYAARQGLTVESRQYIYATQTYYDRGMSQPGAHPIQQQPQIKTPACKTHLLSSDNSSPHKLNLVLFPSASDTGSIS